MLNEFDKKAIIEYAKKYNVATLDLFGSSLEEGTEARDIDLGVKGIDPKQFFKFYGELSRHLSKELDLIDLSHKSLFNELVEKRGSKSMDEILQDIAAEKERINDTLKALEKTLGRKRRTFVELAAIATCLHNSYSGIENLLKRVFKHLKLPFVKAQTVSGHADK